jgi:hypothetical protein
MPNPFRYFNSSPEVIRLVVMIYVKYPLSPRNVEDLLAERGIDVCHEMVRFWWIRFGPMFAAEIRRKRVQHMRAYAHWRWHLDEVYVKINGQMGVVRPKGRGRPSPPYRSKLEAWVRAHGERRDETRGRATRLFPSKT